MKSFVKEKLNQAQLVFNLWLNFEEFQNYELEK
jgi:hypothetical protein